MNLNEMKQYVQELDMEKRKIHLEKRLNDEQEATQLVAIACKTYNCELFPVFDKENKVFQMSVESKDNNDESLKLCIEYIQEVLKNYHVDFMPIITIPENMKKEDIKPEDINYDVYLLTTW